MTTVDFLATVPGFDALSGEDLDRAAAGSKILSFNDGDVADAVLSSPKTSTLSSDDHPSIKGPTGWFAKVTGKTDPNVSATRSFEATDLDG